MADLKTPESPEKPVPVSRRYTPISDVSNTKGFDLLLKIYRKTEKFPFGGLMTQYLESLSVFPSFIKNSNLIFEIDRRYYQSKWSRREITL